LEVFSKSSLDWALVYRVFRCFAEIRLENLDEKHLNGLKELRKNTNFLPFHCQFMPPLCDNSLISQDIRSSRDEF
jgi:hypothetical protein